MGDQHHHHNHHHRRRHLSGVSIEELHECDPLYAVEVTGGSFSWDLDTRELTLKNIDVQIPSGSQSFLLAHSHIECDIFYLYFNVTGIGNSFNCLIK